MALPVLTLLRAVSTALSYNGSSTPAIGTPWLTSSDINPVTSATANTNDGVLLPALGGMQMIILNFIGHQIQGIQF